MFKQQILSQYKIISRNTDALYSKLHDIIFKPSFFKAWFARGGDGDSMWSEHIEVEGDEEATREKAEEWFEEQWNHFEKEYSRNHQGGSKIMLWRCIGVDDSSEFVSLLEKGKYLKGFTGVGIYWSFDKEIAECHWGAGSSFLVVEAEVPISSVDLKRTANAIMNISTGREEAEITLKKNSPIKVTQVYDNHDSELLSKTLMAKA